MNSKTQLNPSSVRLPVLLLLTAPPFSWLVLFHEHSLARPILDVESRQLHFALICLAFWLNPSNIHHFPSPTLLTFLSRSIPSYVRMCTKARLICSHARSVTHSLIVLASHISVACNRSIDNFHGRRVPHGLRVGTVSVPFLTGLECCATTALFLSYFQSLSFSLSLSVKVSSYLNTLFCP